MTNFFNSENYYGSIEYSKADNCLFGKVLGFGKEIGITYEGNKENNIKPRKSYSGVLNIRIPSEVHYKIARYSENTGTSINAFIRESIEQRLEYTH